ncbi:MAG: SHOCT domain-containing protein [Synergistaceae bacterium]|nr:SHOCT domain-containing protein [Synergistaceae bacterium]
MYDYTEILEELSSGSEIADELRLIIERNVSMPNIPFPTMGGLVFWNNIAECNGWKLQQNMITHHARIIDSNDVRIAWGTLDEMKDLLEDLANYLKLQREVRKNENLATLEEIKKLKELLDIGAIDIEEFRQKKTELMSKVQ